MDGLKRISTAFDTVRTEKRAALIPYLTLGYPEPMLSLSLIEAASNAGADIIELGLPFSDPLADGPTIQHSTQVALQQGMTLARCIDSADKLRYRGVTQPLLMMGYINPILSYGIEAFVKDATQAGVDGFIIPDLPPDEAAALEAACQAQQRALVFLASPNSTPQRLALLAQRTSGFLYLVSVTGVTGARAGLPNGLQTFVERARTVAHTPVAVGFGIHTPEQAARVGSLADGVIVGSALINAIDAGPDPLESVSQFVGGLAKALKN
jgi:tryptophan synthase alpha chain